MTPHTNPLWIFLLVIALDLIFFSINQSFLQKVLHDVQGKSAKVRWLGALICYIALTVILYTFRGSYLRTFLLGTSIYAVYEGTNYAVFQAWPLKMVILDTLWGGTLFVLVKYLLKL